MYRSKAKQDKLARNMLLAWLYLTSKDTDEIEMHKCYNAFIWADPMAKIQPYTIIHEWAWIIERRQVYQSQRLHEPDIIDASTYTVSQLLYSRFAFERSSYQLCGAPLPALLKGGGWNHHALHIEPSTQGRKNVSGTAQLVTMPDRDENIMSFPTSTTGNGRELYNDCHIRQALAQLQMRLHPSIFQCDMQVEWTCICEADLICSLDHFDPQAAEAGTVAYTFRRMMNDYHDASSSPFFVYGDGIHWRAIGFSTRDKTIYLMDPYGV